MTASDGVCSAMSAAQYIHMQPPDTYRISAHDTPPSPSGSCRVAISGTAGRPLATPRRYERPTGKPPLPPRGRANIRSPPPPPPGRGDERSAVSSIRSGRGTCGACRAYVLAASVAGSGLRRSADRRSVAAHSTLPRTATGEGRGRGRGQGTGGRGHSAQRSARSACAPLRGSVGCTCGSPSAFPHAGGGGWPELSLGRLGPDRASLSISAAWRARESASLEAE